MRRELQLPPHFDFHATLRSHGWLSLAPFRYDEDSSTLSTALELSGRAVPLQLTATGRSVVVYVPSTAKVSTRAGHEEQLVAAARTILNLDADLRPFYERVGSEPDWNWIRGSGAGRLLRAPTIWEDLVKLILTTNCSWALTQRMSQNLVTLYGAKAAPGVHAFPTPRRLAAISVEELRAAARVGYRAPMLASLAQQVDSGEVNPNRWPQAAETDAVALRTELLKLPGVGPYVADNVVRLLGRPAGLGLDSWLRSRQREVYHGGREIQDRTIERRYARFGRWAGLVLWCDMVRERNDE